MADPRRLERGQELWHEAERILDVEGPRALHEWESNLTESDQADMDFAWATFVVGLKAFAEACRVMGERLDGLAHATR